MRAKEFVTELTYKGNIGMMEMFKFHQVATPEQKQLMQQLISEKKYSHAWKLLKKVTNTNLKEDLSRRGFLTGLGATALLGPTKLAKDKQVNPVKKISKGISQNPKYENLLIKVAEHSGILGIELAQFLAQMKHESWDFTTLKEKPHGLHYFAKKYDVKHNPRVAKILGNKHPGDGEKYYGRGFIQLTGRDNYKMAQDYLKIPLVNNPDLASNPEIAAKIAVWYWKTRVEPNINNFSDTTKVTRLINSGMHGLQDRHNNFKQYLALL